VWVVESSKDPIADTGQFAADPSDTDFGARVIGQDATVPRSSSVWEYDTDSHDAYFRELPGNAGLRRIGDIITEGDIP
jgi:hypothetical protein